MIAESFWTPARYNGRRSKGQDRLDKITQLIASTTGTEVCSIYLLRDSETLELCATEGLEIGAVHQTRMRIGEGLVEKLQKEIKQ